MFKRPWDGFPKLWDSWDSNGVEWWIQDLPEEDDEKAIDLIVNYLCPDETMCICSGLIEDLPSLEGFCVLWREVLKSRMSLACYTYVEGKKTLVGLNVCDVKCIGQEGYEAKSTGEAYRNIMDCLHYVDSKVDVFKYYGIDKVLIGMGLVVHKDFRGEKLGTKILNAREPLCKHVGIKATETVFTGPASQKSAARCGFETLSVVTLKELAQSGLNYPRDENRVMKLMSKKYE